jgi:hypothetical protein
MRRPVSAQTRLAPICGYPILESQRCHPVAEMSQDWRRAHQKRPDPLPGECDEGRFEIVGPSDFDEDEFDAERLLVQFLPLVLRRRT